jgi:iron complex transport system substrate-binding protein
MRRLWRVLTGVLVVALLGALAACGSSSDDSSHGAPDGSAKPDAATSGSGAFPAKVATEFGTVTVEKRPARVVALGWGDAETALALGVQPVGQSDWLAFGGDGVGPWAQGRYDKSPEKIGTLEPEYEKIAALKPDLILDVKSSGDETRHNTLSKIAPTIGVPKGGEQYKISWEKQTTMISEALGLADRGKKLIADTERKFTAEAQAHPEFKGRTITIGSRTSNGWGAYVKGTSRVDFAQKLGFVNNPKVDAKAGAAFSVPVSAENLTKSIPGVRQGHSVVFDNASLSQAFATNSVLSVGYALDKMVPVFAKALRQ